MSNYFLSYCVIHVHWVSLVNHTVQEQRLGLYLLWPSSQLSAWEQPVLREDCRLCRNQGFWIGWVLDLVPWALATHFCFHPQILIVHNHAHTDLLTIKG